MKTVLGKALIAAGMLGLAAGCASSDNAKAARNRNPAPCPSAIVLQDAARLVDFAGEGEAAQTAENIAWTAEVESVSLDCRYFGDVPIKASLKINFAFGRGPAADGFEREYKYFVAVTRTDQEVIAKQTYVHQIKFDKKSAVERLEDKVNEIVIPRAGAQTSGTNFEIVVGLALTREELFFNRSGKSLKFPSL